MLVIVPSRLCSEFFHNKLDGEPFPHLPIEIEHRILTWQHAVSPANNFENADLILYTNVWPVSDSEDQLKAIIRIAKLNSAGHALVASLDKSRYRVSYPRKSDIDFPARSVTWMTLNPKLWWNITIRRCFLHSVSLTMFAVLAFDVVFHATSVLTRVEAALARRMEKEYLEAYQLYPKMGIEVHGYRTAPAPFAKHDPVLIS